MDVTNEMVAMNRDIENILSRYGSNFDQPADNELGERGRGYNGNNKPGSSGLVNCLEIHELGGESCTSGTFQFSYSAYP